MSLAQIYKGIHRNVWNEEYLKCAVGVVEANFDAVCCIDVLDSNSRSLASLYFGCFLLFAFEDILNPPCCRTQTHFQGWSQQQNSTTKVKRVQRNSHCSTAFCIHPAFGVSTRGAAVGQQSEPLPFLSGSRSSQVSHLHLQALTQQHYGECEGIRDPFCDCTSLKVVQVNRNAAGLAGWLQSLEDDTWKTCQSLQCIHSWPDMTRDGMVMSGVTAVINISILSFTLLVSLQTSTCQM